jgi:hypothetical protein
MKKILLVALLAAVTSTSVLAHGRGHGYYGGYHGGHRGGWVAPLVIGSVVGGIIGYNARGVYAPPPPVEIYTQPPIIYNYQGDVSALPPPNYSRDVVINGVAYYEQVQYFPDCQCHKKVLIQR